MLPSLSVNSPLVRYDDLEHISTFGFRGEALSSISHVSRMTITTKTKDRGLAVVAHYVDGELRGAPRDSAPVGLCATTGSDSGTEVKFEDLFYNNASRKKVLSSLWYV